MKISNFIHTILYKIYKDSVLLSSDYKNRDLYLENINLKLENWIVQLNNWNFVNHTIENIKSNLINEIFDLQSQKNINVYQLWDVQNKIDMLFKVRYEK